MRLIDADALKERIDKICDKVKEDYEHSDFAQYIKRVMIAQILRMHYLQRLTKNLQHRHG